MELSLINLTYKKQLMFKSNPRSSSALSMCSKNLRNSTRCIDVSMPWTNRRATDTNYLTRTQTSLSIYSIQSRLMRSPILITQKTTQVSKAVMLAGDLTLPIKPSPPYQALDSVTTTRTINQKTKTTVISPWERRMS